MYTRRNYTVKSMLLWTRRSIYIFIILSTIPVLLYTVLRWYWLHLPWLPIGLVGTAVAFITGFKNNTSYSRLWEARKIWGGIVNTSRSFTIMVNDFIDAKEGNASITKKELADIKKRLIMRHIGWMTSLRYALRSQKPWELSYVNKADREYIDSRIKVSEHTIPLEEALAPYLSDAEKKYVLNKKNRQTACINLQSKDLKALKDNGFIWKFSYLEMERTLVQLYDLQGKAERIKNFPYPRQFATLNRFFVWIFIFFLPYGMMCEFDKIGKNVVAFMEQFKPYPDVGYHHLIELIGIHFVWFTIPFSVIIAWIFHTMERIGETSENPFEGNTNDVPITTMARDIEIDIRQMIGDDENEIPAPIPEQDHIQM
ncbi:bestrophin family ion channel [Tenacibaculum maritimum]|uniref:bestrophin family protein n=1 Tax=Tenacibaculum maritimum TaxID=107401 RepID=UPI0038775470